MRTSKAPIVQRKVDTKQNRSDLEHIIQKQMQRERTLHPLRVSNTTVIYVTKNKCTPEYAEEYRRNKLNLK